MPTFKPLPRSFYARPAAVVAKECLGKHLVHEVDGQVLVGRIVEAEAYLGTRDRAAHSFAGHRSRRNEVTYGAAGHAYVFFIYGMHVHLNLVTDCPGLPTAVLIRAVEPLAGEDSMMRRRGYPAQRTLLTNGPGKLCQAFGIRMKHNGADLCKEPLYLAAGDPPAKILRCARIGVDYAGSWARRMLRFIDVRSEFVSVVAKSGRAIVL
jgi:DNA-3-methyladenine glycosylase